MFTVGLIEGVLMILSYVLFIVNLFTKSISQIFIFAPITISMVMQLVVIIIEGDL